MGNLVATVRFSNVTTIRITMDFKGRKIFFLPTSVIKVGLWEWGWTAGKVLGHHHLMTHGVCHTLLPWLPLLPCSEPKIDGQTTTAKHQAQNQYVLVTWC